MTEHEEKIEEKKISQSEDIDIENTIKEMESKTPFIRKEDLKNLKKNSLWFLKFYRETIAEKTEAESYPAFFLPSLISLGIFFLGIWMLFQKISDFLIAKNMSGISFKGIFCGFILSVTAIISFIGALILNAIYFKGNKNHEEACITAAMFTTPTFIGMLLAWLLSYGSFALSLILILIAFTAGIMSMYAALPKTMLLKGNSRFVTVISAVSVLFITTNIVFRLLSTIFG